MSRRSTTIRRLPAVLATALLALSCRDATGPDPDYPGPPTLAHGDGTAGLDGSGAIGSGAAVAGADRQEFEIDVAWDLTGRVTFRDWSVVRSNGTVATVTVDASDRGTWLAALRTSSSACADPARGAEVDAMGRLDTGDLLFFTIVSCDNAPAGAGADFFRFVAPTAGPYDRGGVLSAGDIVVSNDGDTPATATDVAGIGAIGPGTPTPGSDRQEFDFDVSPTLGGRLNFSDWSVLRGNGLPGRIVVGGVAGTGVVAFHQVTATCVRFSGTGQLDSGDFWPFFIDVCDNASPGTGFDTFAITIPDRVSRGVPYFRSGTLTAGDIIQTGGGGDDPPPPPATGDLNVTTATTGSNIDPDGYTVTLDGANGRSIPANGSTTYEDLGPGSHTVTLSGVAGNCTVAGGTSRTVTVTAGETAATAFSVTCAAAPPTRLAFIGQPTTVTAGNAISPAVRVAARDDAGNTVTSYTGTITLALAANPSGGTLSGTMTATAVNGVATFSNLRIAKAGAGYSLGATASGLAGATSSTFSVIPGSATTLVFTVQPSNVDTDKPITPAVRVTARDAHGNTATAFNGSMTMTIARNPAGGTLAGTRTVTASGGVGTFSDLRINRAGDGYSLAVNASGLAGAESSQFNVRRPPLICVLGICL